MANEEYHLTAEERATLQPDLDHDALEALLRTLPAEARPVHRMIGTRRFLVMPSVLCEHP